jgi:hypothetical protein
MMIVDAKTGEIADPVLVDRKSGRPLTGPDFRVVAGPAANETLKKRYQSLPPTTSLMESPR